MQLSSSLELLLEVFAHFNARRISHRGLEYMVSSILPNTTEPFLIFHYRDGRSLSLSRLVDAYIPPSFERACNMEIVIAEMIATLAKLAAMG